MSDDDDDYFAAIDVDAICEQHRRERDSTHNRVGS